MLWRFYADSARELPWRKPEPDGKLDPYAVLVSEIMLQQTQVDRVTPKFEAFMAAFPAVEQLAQASLHDVFTHWNGLGYNRRAKYLHEAARALAGRPFPRSIKELTELHGVGYNTAAAVLTYAFNQPHVFVETNIRTVVIHHFFADASPVTDKEITGKLTGLLAGQSSPRDFMWAMMDYGTYLKKSGVHNLAQSKHYTKQSAFAGSVRQLRGEVLRRAAARQSLGELHAEISDERLDDVLAVLAQEGLIDAVAGHLRIRES